MSDLSWNSRGEYLRFLERIYGRGNQRVGVSQGGSQRTLCRHAVQRIAELGFRLAKNVIRAIVGRLSSFHVIHEVLRLGLRNRLLVDILIVYGVPPYPT